MAKPKLDFKKLLLERGERIGLSVAGIITLLLLFGTLVWPRGALFSGSPDEKAKGLIEPANVITQKLSDPNNQPGDDDKPDKNSKDKLIALNEEPVDAEKFRMASLIPIGGAGSAGRRVPKVLSIDEAIGKLARMQIQTYMLDDNGNIYVLVGKEGSAKSGQNKGLSGMLGPKGKMGGAMGGAMGGGPKEPGAGGKGRGLPPGMAGGGSGEEKVSKKLIAIPLEKLAGRTDATPAERIRPLRMAIVAASFPYKAQIEEFRSKLALRSANEVLTENGAEKLKGQDDILRSFHFTGVEAERRELDGDGNPVSKDKNGGWVQLDLLKDYQPYVILTGARFEEEDPELKAITFRGLVMPRLQGFRPESAAKGEGMAGSGPLGAPGGVPRGPGGPMGPGGRPMGKGSGDGNVKEEGEKHKDLYPPVEREVANIRKTIESLKGKSGKEILAPPSRFQGIANIFDPTAPTEPKEKDGGDEKPMTPDAGKTDPEAREVPEHCLVRIIDTTIQPGKTYEYRLRVKMVNPNYKRLDVANPAYSTEESLPSEWSKPTPPIHVDPELRYYAIDQKALYTKDMGKYDGPNPTSRIDADRQVWLQADRWVERVSFRGAEHEFGEWTVAERFSAYRGEYVGRKLRTQLPVWRFDREEFTIADDFKTKTRPGTPSRPEIDVDFGYGLKENAPQPEAIAVDFQSGRQTIEKVKTRNEEGAVAGVEKVTDEAASEVLLLDPSGRLCLLEGGLDAIDKTREERRLQARERVREISQGKKADGGKSDKPFGN